MNEITNYIIALSNLYGMVHPKKVIEIYNSQNEEQIDYSHIEEIWKKEFDIFEKYYVYLERGYFASQAVVYVELFDGLIEQKRNKPYYVPEKEELLKYKDDGYFEETQYYKDLFQYIKQHFYPSDEEKLIETTRDIQMMCASEYSLSSIFAELERVKLTFKDAHQFNEMGKLIAELSNNTRIWSNNGYTPNELYKKMDKSRLRVLSDDIQESHPVDFHEKETEKKKVGRNDPCPCGSGKKYKKCCLNKNISKEEISST